VKHFIARQPIFDLNNKVNAYEILFRSGLDNYFDCDNADHAAASVIVDSTLLFDLNEMTNNTKAFFNCTATVLKQDSLLTLPPKQVVIEILEDVKPTPDIITACQKLKGHGYTLALDDFVYHEDFEPLLNLVDIVKVDFLLSDAAEQERLAQVLIPRGKTMLAEKVETLEVYEHAKAMGYRLFQGYYFARPVILSRQDIPTNKLQFLQILKEIHSPNVEFKKLATIIQSEVSLSYKLLKLINSAAFSLRYKVTSILQALSLLGLREIRSWISFLSIMSMADDKPTELVVSSLIRAKLCDQLSEPLNLPEHQSNLFLLGLFSLLDVLMSRPIEEILQEITVDDDLLAALSGEAGKLRNILDLVIAIEKGQWEQVSDLAKTLQLDEAILANVYIEAIKWAQNVYKL